MSVLDTTTDSHLGIGKHLRILYLKGLQNFDLSCMKALARMLEVFPNVPTREPPFRGHRRQQAEGPPATGSARSVLDSPGARGAQHQLLGAARGLARARARARDEQDF